MGGENGRGGLGANGLQGNSLELMTMDWYGQYALPETVPSQSTGGTSLVIFLTLKRL